MMHKFKEERRPLKTERWEGMPKGHAENSEAIIRGEAQRLLQESPYRELWEVGCDFRDGELTLQGRVPSFFLKQIAQSIVFVIEPVETINNRLEVVAAAREKR
jgi:hypothetical protein